MKAIKHYLWGLGASMVNGGISSVSGILGIDGVSMTGLSSQARILNGHEMLAAFCGACLVHGIFWLKAHPLPESNPFDSPTNNPTNEK